MNSIQKKWPWYNFWYNLYKWTYIYLEEFLRNSFDKSSTTFIFFIVLYWKDINIVTKYISYIFTFFIYWIIVFAELCVIFCSWHDYADHHILSLQKPYKHSTSFFFIILYKALWKWTLEDYKNPGGFFFVREDNWIFVQFVKTQIILS